MPTFPARKLYVLLTCLQKLKINNQNSARYVLNYKKGSSQQGFSVFLPMNFAIFLIRKFLMTVFLAVNKEKSLSQMAAIDFQLSHFPGLAQSNLPMHVEKIIEGVITEIRNCDEKEAQNVLEF